MRMRMRSRLSSIAATVGIAAMTLVSASASTAGRGFTPEDTYLVRTAGDVQLSPDGSRLLYVVRSMDRATNRNRSQAWLTVIADGTIRRLTPADADDTSPRWSPDGKAFASLSSDGGKPAVVVTRVDDGSRRAVAQFETSS